jgi:hypothetical protein
MHARPERPHSNVKGIGKNSRPRSILLVLRSIQHCFIKFYFEKDGIYILLIPLWWYKL